VIPAAGAPPVCSLIATTWGIGRSPAILLQSTSRAGKHRPSTPPQSQQPANLRFACERRRRPSDGSHWNLTVTAAHPATPAPTDPTLFSATSPAAQPNGDCSPKGFYEMKGPVGPASIAPRARDEATANRLSDVSEPLTGIRLPQ
jgi:hypothetical protein